MSDDIERAAREAALIENVPDLASYGFAAAQTHCHACHEYHALWGYFRLAGFVNGVETDRAMLEPVLRSYCPPGGRVLIAGSADAGLSALSLRVLGDLSPRLTVADRCETPLLVCRRFAERCGAELEVQHADLAEQTPFGPFDLVFGHLVMRFVPEARQAHFLAHLAHSLAPGGALVMVVRLPRDNRDAPARNYPRVIEALKERGVALPESEPAFARRLLHYGTMRPRAESDVSSLDEAERHFAEVGLEVMERIAHDNRTTIPARDGGARKVVPTYILVARRLG